MKFLALNTALVVTSVLLFSSCASGPKVSENKTQPQLAVVQPSYSDHVDAVTVEQLHASSCPADSKWTAQPWQKLVPIVNACVKAKDWSKVEKMGDWLARNAQLTPWGPYYLSLSAEFRRDYPRAVWMLELALKKAPKEGLFHYELGRIHWELNETAEAVKHLQLASDLNPSLTSAHWLLGQLALQKQDLGTAERLLLKALASNSEHGPSLLAMAQLKMMSKDWEKAEGFLVHAIAISPRNTNARLALALVQEQHLQKTADAIRTYKQIRQMASERKLDSVVQINLDEKIQVLQKTLSQASDASKQRQPSAEAPKSDAKGTVKQ